jgi:hypothetical protein
MNKLILLILLNILVYHLYHKNIYLLIALFIFIIYYTLQIRKNIKEGNSEDLYKYRFANSLNNNIKNSRKKDNIYDTIIDKLNTFLRIYIDSENIPDEQPCIGIFDSWSKCSADCGVGEKYRTYHVLQPSGKYGIKCVFEDGEIDKRYCHKGKCKINEVCDSNEDCSSNYCSPFTSVCSIENACTKYQLYNCDFEECQNLGKNYHYDINGKCIDYSERENIPEYPGEKLGITTKQPPSPGPSPSPSPGPSPSPSPGPSPPSEEPATFFDTESNNPLCVSALLAYGQTKLNTHCQKCKSNTSSELGNIGICDDCCIEN